MPSVRPPNGHAGMTAPIDNAMVKTDSARLAPVRASWESGKPVEWVQVHKLPDHAYFDHICSLAALVQANPKLKVITSFIGVGIMGLSAAPLPIERFHLVNRQPATVGDRS